MGKSKRMNIFEMIEQEAYPDGDQTNLHLPDKHKIEIVYTKDKGSSRKRFKFTDNDLQQYFENIDPYETTKVAPKKESKQYTGHDIISRLCENAVLVVELGKHLPVRDILVLHSVCKSFHNSVNTYLLSNIRAWIAYKAPEAGRIFPFQFYRRHLVPDPIGRTWEQQYAGCSSTGSIDDDDDDQIREIRSVPGLKYLQLVVGRETCCREITAIMARNGHRMPATMRDTLLKLWLLMDISTTAQRRALLRNQNLWTDIDLYNAQLLFLKLGMHFNDPIYGPSSYELLHLMMGQKGLYPLWQLLMRKAYLRLSDILKLKVRYDFQMPPGHWGHEYYGSSIHGVPFDQVGTTHLEGWGTGKEHLLRPDELIPVESVARGLDLDNHLIHMMLWGYFDWETGENLVPTQDEMYISDQENVLSEVDTTDHWRHKHVLKKKWKNLTLEQQQEIINEDEDERLRAMAWCGSDIDSCSSHSGDDAVTEEEYDLDEEMERGFIVPPQQEDSQPSVPNLEDREGWVDFVNLALRGLALEVDDDEALRAQAWQSYQTVELEEDDLE